MMLPLNEQLPVTFLAWSAILLTAFFLGLRIHRTLAAEQQKQRSVVELVHAELPQTQCGRCGFPGCLPYAEAISDGEPINQCPPGGEHLILRLARLLNEPPEPLNPRHGTPQKEPLVAVIREPECIGCTKCIQACPVDAILGSAKTMHTVLTSECTGCDLCVEPCPVDCIDIVPAASQRNQRPLKHYAISRGLV